MSFFSGKCKHRVIKWVTMPNGTRIYRCPDCKKEWVMKPRRCG